MSKNKVIRQEFSDFSESEATVKCNNSEKTVSLCRKCHTTCKNADEKNDIREGVGDENQDSWSSLMMLGMYGILPSTLKVCNDPFSPLEPPSISVLPPTPDKQVKAKEYDTNFSSHKNNSNISDLSFSGNGVGGGGGSGVGGSSGCNSINGAQFVAPSEQSVKRPHIKLTAQNDVTPEKSVLNNELLHKKVISPTLRRFGTLNSLEKINLDEQSDHEEKEEGNESEKKEESEDKKIEVKSHPPQVGDSIRGWTVRAGSFVAAKMAFFERLSSPDNTMTVRKTTYLERYLKPSGENHLDSSPDLGTNTSSSGKEEEGETSGATSGEEIWGTPTSGGEFEEELIGENSNFPFFDSPRESIGADDDSEQMLEHLLISLPMAAARNYVVPPRRKLEPLLEEDDTESSSAPCSPKYFLKFKNGEGGSLNGTVQKQPKNVTKTVATFQRHQDTPRENMIHPKIGSIDRALGIHFDDDEDDEEEEEEFEKFSPGKPSLLRKLGLKKNIRRDFSRRKGSRLLGFLGGKKVDSKIGSKHSAIYGAKPLFRYLFNKDSNDGIPTTLPPGSSPSGRNEKQLERRFWNHLKRRRNLSGGATTASADFQSTS